MSTAVIYCRVSSEDQIERNVLNLPTQERKCRKHCEQQGWNVLRVFTDAGESARTADRPQLQEMLAYCRQNKGKVTHVVVADLSRLARNVFDQGSIIAILAEHKIKLSSVDEPMLDSSAAGKFSLNVLGALNQFYSDNQSEKIKYRMRAAVEQGRFVNRAPIGYKNVQSNGTKSIVIERERAPLIKKAFELVASGSYSSDAVLRTVTALGLRTPNGLVLPKQSFSKMLKNPIYAGWVCFPAAT